MSNVKAETFGVVVLVALASILVSVSASAAGINVCNKPLSSFQLSPAETAAFGAYKRCVDTTNKNKLGFLGLALTGQFSKALLQAGKIVGGQCGKHVVTQNLREYIYRRGVDRKKRPMPCANYGRAYMDWLQRYDPEFRPGSGSPHSPI